MKHPLGCLGIKEGIVMKIVVVGSGGREHAIGWAFYREGVDVIYVKGNGGTLMHGVNMEEIPWHQKDILVIPGSETYIASGIADGRKNVFSPDSKGALLETSKAWAKGFMVNHGIPTAEFQIVDEPTYLETALSRFEPPYVIKADGLAGGKGVIITNNKKEALVKGRKLMEGELLEGVKGPVVVEKYLTGTEISAMAIVSGEEYVLLPFIRDYKRLNDGGIGPNTGGMGAVGPISISSEIVTGIKDIYNKTLQGLMKKGIVYKGFLYLGLMIGTDGIYVLEYNVRLGDPETEVLVKMNSRAFVENIINAVEGKKLQDVLPQCFAADVVVASKGYPFSPKKGIPIRKEPKGFAFYGGVSRDKGGRMIVTGGRVFHCMGTGMKYSDAIKEAYQCASTVEFEGAFFRKDIGKVIER